MQMWRRSDYHIPAHAPGGFIADGAADGAVGGAAETASKGVASGLRSGTLAKFGAPLLLLTALWAARYWRFAEFGLYEDDLTFIPRAVQMNFPQLSAFVFDYVVHLYGHARPLSDSFIHIFSNLGWRIGGLPGIYFLGFAVEALNVVLFYAFLRRLRATAGFAMIGGLAFVLFSADTTQAFLTHSLGLQPSLSLLLLAFHAWLSHRRLLAYALAFVILFAYESPYPVFFAAPLLDQPWDRRLPRSLLIHAALAGLILIVAAGTKAVAGEERVAGMSAADAVLIPINHMIVGPAVSLATFVLRPLEALRGLDPGVFAAILVATGVFAWALTRNDTGPSTDLAASLAWLRARVSFGMTSRRVSESVRANAAPLALRLTVAGLAMWILAYPLTYTTLGYHIRGRPTRVHLAAVVGSSLVVATVVASSRTTSPSSPAAPSVQLGVNR